MTWLRCIECDAYTTGVEDHNADGFARCAAHARMMFFRWSADAAIPRVKGRESKTWRTHRQSFRESLTRRAIDTLTRAGTFYEGQRYVYALAEGRLIVAPGDWEPGTWERVTTRPQAPAGPILVKACDIFGTTHETHATEAELNGHRPAQLPMFAPHEVATKPRPRDPRQQELF